MEDHNDYRAQQDAFFFFSVLATSSSIFDMLEGGNTLTGTSGTGAFSLFEKKD